MTASQMTEAQTVQLMRNALLAAGHEMGKDGDHWPVIKSTVFSVMKDYEGWQTEHNVFGEMKRHYQDMIRELQALSNDCAPESKPHIDAAIIELLELYSACFTPIDERNLYIGEEDIPLHLKRAGHIIEMLEGDANG